MSKHGNGHSEKVWGWGALALVKSKAVGEVFGGQYQNSIVGVNTSGLLRFRNSTHMFSGARSLFMLLMKVLEAGQLGIVRTILSAAGPNQKLFKFKL